MTRKLSLRTLLAAGVCLLPLQVLAQSSDSGFDVGEKPPEAAALPDLNNWVTLGGQYQSTGSYHLGQYSGNVNPGFYGIGDFHYGQRDPWDSGGTNYFEMQGNNLGFWDRSFSAKVGQQGTWGLFFNYDGIPYYATDQFQSIYQGNGLLVPGVKPGSLSPSYVQILPKNGILNSLWMPRLASPPTGSMFNYDLSTRRDVYTTGGKYQFDDWTITSSWRHEHKEGQISSSLEIGGAPSVTTAGTGATKPTTFTSGLAFFALPIDYDTDRFDINAAYSTARMQAQFGYTFSNFNNNNNSFDAQNPWNFTPTTSFGGPVTNVSAIYALPPSNSAHQLKGMLGYNFTPTTRLNVNVGYGLNLQNQAYVTGIGNTNIPQQALPRSSFNGQAQTTFANIALTTQLMNDWDLRLAYTFNDYDNQSPQNAYTVYPTSAANTSFTYLNLPFSYQHQTAVVETGYRITPRTKLTVDDTYDYTYRTYTDASVVQSNRITAKLRTPLADDVFSTLSAAYESRWVNNYNVNGWWQQACGGCNSEPPNFIMFNEASRQRVEIKSTLDYSPTNNVTATMMMKYDQDTYPQGQYGLRNNNNFSIGPDVSWQVSSSVTAHAYYTFQQIYYNQSSIYQSPGAPAVPAPTATNTQYNVPWTAKTTDNVHTVGVNTDWQVIPDKLKLSFDYNFSYGDTAYALGEGVIAYGGAITSPTFRPSINMQALPDVTSMLSVISLHGEYKIRPNMTFLFGYAWERFTYKDFMAGTSSTQYANAFLPGTTNPNDSVQIVSAALRVRF